MKSPEQAGGTPEQPKYDEAEWEKLKQRGPADALEKGKEMSVPQEELDKFAQDIIKQRTEGGDYGFVYRFKRNFEIGTKEEILEAGKKAYQYYLDEDFPDSAMEIAKEIFGENSEEAKHARDEFLKKKKLEETKEEELELEVILPKDATFTDLFKAIDDIEEKEGLSRTYFDEELAESFKFDSETVEEIMSLRIDRKKAASTKVIDFFKKHGYTKKDITAYLPVRFKRK